MPPKQDSITVKVESALLKRVEQLSSDIERNLKVLTPERINKELLKIAKQIRDVGHDLQSIVSTVEELNERLFQFTGKKWWEVDDNSDDDDNNENEKKDE